MRPGWKENNYYDILEVSPKASPREIQDAFKRAKATYAQDNPALYSMFTKEEAQELMRIIDEAYETLGDQRLRLAYDQQLKLGEAASSNREFVIPESNEWSDSAKEESRWNESPSAFQEPGASIVKTRIKPVPVEGMGQTQFGSFKIDPAFEKEIAECERFDGPFLQKIRVYKNLTLDNMSAATRVSRTYLAAVENMDLKALPAAVFVRGFVCQISKVLGLDEKKTSNTYMAILKQVSESKRS